MSPQQMQSLLRKEPFETLRIHLHDGRSFDINYPRLNLVTELRLVIGIPDENDPSIANRVVRVPWATIKDVEPAKTA